MDSDGRGVKEKAAFPIARTPVEMSTLEMSYCIQETQREPSEMRKILDSAFTQTPFTLSTTVVDAVYLGNVSPVVKMDVDE